VLRSLRIIRINPMTKNYGMTKFFFLLFGSVFIQSLTAQTQIDEFEEKYFDSSEGTSLPYRIHTPLVAFTDSELALIVYLHGSGGNGTDNVKQISGGNVFGTHLWIKPEVAVENPAFVLAPQSPNGAPWGDCNYKQLTRYSEIVIELIVKLIEDLPIDPNRIYLMGQSKGGRGVWDILSKRPDLFAAGVPVCGSGNADLVKSAFNTPIWAFHGALDPVISVEESRNLVEALELVGGNIRYTEYPNVRHNSWENAFSNPNLPIWLFAQRRND